MHTTIDIARTSHPSPAPTRLACHSASALGLTLDDLPSRSSGPLRLGLAPGSLTVLSGPSGSGKTTLRADLHRAFEGAHWPERTRVVDPGALRPRNRSCLDLLGARGTDATGALARLARCGLADGAAISARFDTLSDGQRERLLLALAMRRCERLARSGPVLLSVDELGARVDEASARAVARCLRRWLKREAGKGLDIRCVVTTHRTGALAQLRPATLVHLSALGEATIEQDQRDPEAFDDLYEIGLGTRADLATLAPLHYRPGAPATIARVLRCTDRSTGRLAGVLGVSLPTLNARWRELAWPGRYSTGDRSRDAHRLCAEVRCISRVIVEPSHRSMGVARRLIEAYLDRPLTPMTEALSAMGRVSPIFERAGMTPQPLPIPARHQRLLDALEAVGIDAWRLAQPEAVVARVSKLAPGERALMSAELARWVGASRATRRLRDAGEAELIRRACRAVSAKPVAYTHVS